MVIARAVHLIKAFIIAGGHGACVRNRNASHRDPRHAVRMLDADVLCSSDHADRTAEVDDGLSHAAVEQNIAHLVRGKSFCDSAEIDALTESAQFRGLRLLIQQDILIVDQRARMLYLGAVV